MNKNLVTLDLLNKTIEKKGLDKFIKSIGYSNRINKKYVVVLKDNNKAVHFGDIRFQDFLIHKDKIRRENYRNRFYKIYSKNKDNINSSIFWSTNILW